MRVHRVAGSAYGRTSPVKVLSDMIYADVPLDAGGYGKTRRNRQEIPTCGSGAGEECCALGDPEIRYRFSDRWSLSIRKLGRRTRRRGFVRLRNGF